MTKPTKTTQSDPDYLTPAETRKLAWLYQSNFIGVIGCVRARVFADMVKNTPEYRANRMRIRQLIHGLERSIRDYEYQQFDVYADEMRQKYIEIAAPILSDETIMQCTIVNNLHHENTENASLIAAFIQSWLLTKLSELIITDNKIVRYAQKVGVYGTNWGVNVINKYLSDISKCYDTSISTEFDMEQVMMAFHILDRKFESDEDLLLQIIAANGLKVKRFDKQQQIA